MRKKAYLLLKPYFQNHLCLLSEGLKKFGLMVDRAYKVNDWTKVSLAVYKKTIEKEGELFEIGLHGHIWVTRYLFGNKAILVTFADSNGIANCKGTYEKVTALKKHIRATLKGGPSSNDLLVLMNLKNIKIPKAELLQTKGELGVSLDKGGFIKLAPKSGLWDYYYFKYVHGPETYEEFVEEFDVLKRLGVLGPENEIPMKYFQKMMDLGTYVSPEDFRRTLPWKER